MTQEKLARSMHHALGSSPGGLAASCLKVSAPFAQQAQYIDDLVGIDTSDAAPP
ncbi:MAG: hypothetical protein P8M32_05000 [Phycisphaerales bacterium]|nr:hypothetical protein [Phycisphaerales bacterium]